MDDAVSATAVTRGGSRWMLRTESRPDALITLYCIPHAGGGASTYRMWPHILPTWVDVAGVQLPGRENRIADKPTVNVADVADAVVADADVRGGRPYAVFGHSMGALLTFEVARILAAAGGERAPLYLAISGIAHPPWRTLPEALSELPDAELLARVAALGRLPHEILAEPQIQELFLPALRADISWLEGYRPYSSESLSCPISVFAGEEDKDAQAECLQEWQQETAAECRVRRYPGGHFYLASQVNAVLSDLAADLSTCLGRR